MASCAFYCWYSFAVGASQIFQNGDNFVVQTFTAECLIALILN